MTDFQKPLRKILGHEPTACIPWERDGKSNVSENLAEPYWQWLSSSLQPEVANSLCFLDLALSNIERNQFHAILITPDEEHSEEYRKIVAKVNTSNSKFGRLGTHEVFQAGLPIFNQSIGDRRQPEQDKQPQTLDELRECLRRKLSVVSDNYFSWSDQPSENGLIDRPQTEKVLGESLHSFHCIQINQSDLGHSDDSRKYKEAVLQASNYPVQDSWKWLIEHLVDAKVKLTNARNEPLSCVFAIPLCLWFYDEYQNYLPVAQIFIGLGGRQAEECTLAIAEKLSMNAFRSIGASRAGLVGGLRSRNNIAHRLPGTLESMVLALQKQKKRLEKFNVPFEIPPQFYVLYMVASLQRGLLPRWRHYEDLCKQGAGFVLTPEVIQKMWEELAVPVGLSRVQLDPEPEFRQDWNKVPQPGLRVGKGHLNLGNLNECSTVLSLLCPLLIEAFQHALMWSILDYKKTQNPQQAQVKVFLDEKEIVITNPAHEPRQSKQVSLNMGVQKTEIGEIERLGNFIWTVKFPDAGSLKSGESWNVKIKKRL